MILENLAPKASLGRDPVDPFWYSTIGKRTRAGVDVNESIAETYSACWAATRLLAGTASYLPFGLYQRMPDGTQRMAEETRLHSLLHNAPNPEMSSMMWRASKVAQQINWGNCASEIERTGNDEVYHLWPIHASRLSLKEHPVTEALYYEVKNNDGSVTNLEYRNVFHVPSMMSDDGRWGKGVVRFARETIGHALATERYGGGWFGSGGRPTAVLKHPARMEKEARDNLRREWNEIYGGPDSPNKTAVLWEGMDYIAIATSPEDSQFLESRQHNVEEIARWYGVPPHLIGHLLRSTNNNIEAQGIEYVKYSLLLWIKLWEQEVWRKLLTPAQQRAGFYAKFTVDALERGDVTSRTAALAQQFFNGALTLNQWAKIEDRPPIGPLGDLHFVQSAMVPLEIAAKGPVATGAGRAMAGQEVPPAKPPEPAPVNPRPPEQDDSQRLAVQNASLDVLDDIVGVMLDREAKDALEAAKNPGKFLAWLEAFYDEHAQRMSKALSKPIRACVLASGKPLIVDEVLRQAIASHVSAGKAALLEAAGGPPDGFAAAVEKCVTTWNRTEILDQLKG